MSWILDFGRFEDFGFTKSWFQDFGGFQDFSFPKFRAGVPTPASRTLPKAFFLPSTRPSPPRSKPRFFSFFSFFMLIRRDSNPSPLCLPIHYRFNAYANCAIPARLQIQWFFCMLFICKSNSCPWLAVENNDIMNLRPRGPWGPTGPRTKTNQS